MIVRLLTFHQSNSQCAWWLKIRMSYTVYFGPIIRYICATEDREKIERLSKILPEWKRPDEFLGTEGVSTHINTLLYE